MTDSVYDFDNDSVAWPFPNVPIEDVLALPDADRAFMEQVLLDMANGTDSRH